MIILHDNTSSGDLTHIQAMAEMREGFALFDYVLIKQDDESWIGQVIEPNRNISTVGSPLDATVRHGLQLMQLNPDVQSVESVQVFDILILGAYNAAQNQMLTPRIRPLPGATVDKLDARTTIRVIGVPQRIDRDDGSTNVIGELLNADDVPLCIDVPTFNHHIMIAGGTGSGKSNVAANLIDQAVKFDKCVLVHDAKPDYEFIDRENSDLNVTAIWQRFEKYNLTPRAAECVTRIGFHGQCNPDSVDDVVGFHASDFNPSMLAGLLFTSTDSPLQFEAFAGAADFWYSRMLNNDCETYTLNDILGTVRQRMGDNEDEEDQIHELTGLAILRKVNIRRRDMPWLDAPGLVIGSQRRQNRLGSSSLDSNQSQRVKPFNLHGYVEAGKLLVMDYSGMDDQSYAAILSYFLRICHLYRQSRGGIGIVQMIDEAHRIFDNESRHSDTLAGSFNRIMREGRTADHSIILSLQNASQIHDLVMNNLNSHIVMRQNSKGEADSATQKMGREYSAQSLHLGTGHALVKMFESPVTVLAQMAPSPFELMRTDNTDANGNQ